MSPSTVALVTGATRGLGRTTVSRLAADPTWTVLLGARDHERGSRVAAETGGDVRAVALDVTDDASVDDAARAVAGEHGRLDVLIHNAGVPGALLGPDQVGGDEMREVLETNTVAPVRVTRAFLPLLRNGTDPRLVFVSRGMGSFGVLEQPDRLEASVVVLPYQTSKAALNMIASRYAASLPDVVVTAIDPGFTATEFNGHQGTQSLDEGTAAIVAAAVGTGAPTGRFLDRHGRVPW